MKKYILTGVIILLPIAITVWIAKIVFEYLTEPFIGLIRYVLEQFGFAATMHPGIVFFGRIITLFLILFAICLLGYVAQKLFFNWIINLTNKLFLRIPVIKSIYKITQEIIKSLINPGAKLFKKTVALEFPSKDSKALGFVTGDVPQNISNVGKKVSEEKLKSVFLPTAPHPISGFLLISSENRLKEVDISIEDVFKILVSCGAYHPGEGKDDKK